MPDSIYNATTLAGGAQAPAGLFLASASPAPSQRSFATLENALPVSQRLRVRVSRHPELNHRSG
jgi:hypothetical protein